MNGNRQRVNKWNNIIYGISNQCKVKKRVSSLRTINGLIQENKRMKAKLRNLKVGLKTKDIEYKQLKAVRRLLKDELRIKNTAIKRLKAQLKELEVKDAIIGKLKEIICRQQQTYQSVGELQQSADDQQLSIGVSQVPIGDLSEK